MTKQHTNVSDPADRPALQEIEITPEMIAAGVDALRDRIENEGRFTSWDDRVVREIWLKMDAVRQGKANEKPRWSWHDIEYLRPITSA